jgi:type VI secretion system protein ImpK
MPGAYPAGSPYPQGYPAPPGAPPPYPASPGYPPGYPAPPQPYPGAPQQVYAPAPASHSPEEWISTPTPQAPNYQQQQYQRPVAPPLKVDDLAAPSANPIMRAGGPLLQLLGRLRVSLMRASPAALMEQVAEAIKFFERNIRSAGITEQMANSAKYILCATADDIVQNIPTEDRHVWTQYSMLSRFFGERVGGVRFFEILNHHKLDPLVNYDVLELLHACLALGFQGMYRSQPTGLATLQQIQRDLYETLRRVRPKEVRDLSPRWQGQQLAANSSRLRIPVWVVASTVLALLFGLYVTFRILLSGSAEAAADKTATMHPSNKLELFRVEPPKPPPPPPPPPPQQVTQVQRIRTKIPDHIGDCKINVVETPTQIIIRLCDITFRPGQAVVQDQFKEVSTKIGEALNVEPGKIKVIGHTDSTPIHNVRFPSNWHLSMERAKAVAALMKTTMKDPNRVDVDGKGEKEPIAENTTPEGRARNRRVEIQITRVNE